MRQSSILLFLLLFSMLMHAQKLTVSHRLITTADGLVSRALNDLATGPKGFMWISTDQGLQRFDGQEFRLYTRESHGLYSNIISVKEFDPNGKLWLFYANGFGTSFFNSGGGFSGMELFDPITEAVTPFEEVLAKSEVITKKGEPLQLPNFIAKTDKGEFIVQQGERTLYHYDGKRFIEVFHAPTDIQRFMPLTPESGWYFSPKGKLKYYNQQEVVSTGVAAISASDLNYWQRDDPNRSSGIVLKSGGAAPWRLSVVDNKPVAEYDHSTILKDSHYWRNFVYTSEYMVGIDPKHQPDELVFYTSSNKEPLLSLTLPGLGPNWGYGLKIPYYDVQGNLWLEHEDGLLCLQISQSPFKTYMVDFSRNSMPGFAARGMTQINDSTLFVTGLNGTELLTLQNGRTEGVLVETPVYDNLKDKKKYYASFRLAVYQDPTGKIWFTDERQRLDRFDPITKKTETFTYENFDPSQNYSDTQPSLLWAIHPLENGDLLLGHAYGISIFSQADKVIRWKKEYTGDASLLEATVFHFYENEAGLWAATNKGLYLLNKELEVIRRVHLKGDGASYLPHNTIAYLHENPDSSFWLASKGGGLILWHPKEGVLQQITKSEGLSHNTIYAVYPDNYGNLWIPSDYGIMQYQIESEEVATFLPEDGVSHQEFNTISHYQGTDGTLYFGSLNGITAFHPKDFQHADFLKSPPLRITKVQLQQKDDGEYLDISQSEIADRKLDWNSNIISLYLKFSLLDFVAPDKVQYTYRIEGIDSRWNELNHPELRLSGLPYGTHTLKLRAKANRQHWSEAETLIINVLKPFYLQPWFLISATFLIVGGCYGVYQSRIRAIKKQQLFLESEVQKRTQELEEDRKVIAAQAEELRSLDKLKSRLFVNVSHELRTPITLILGPIEKILFNRKPPKQYYPELQTIQRNGKNLLRLVDEILDLSKLEKNRIEVYETPIEINPFLQEIYHSFLPQAEYLGIKFQIVLPKENLCLFLDHLKLEKIINNLLSNALKHTPAEGIVTLRLQVAQDNLLVSVIDTGKGIAADEQEKVFERFYQSKKQNANLGGTGVGLAFSQELARLINGKLCLNSEEGKGSEFTLSIPTKIAESLSAKSTHNTTARPSALKGDPNLSVISESEEEKLAYILVVEDNLDMSNYIEGLLQTDFKVSKAASGKMALQQLEAAEALPDLIISDIMMPEINGVELIERLKADPRYAFLPIIVLTAVASEKERISTLTLGIDDYLTKPFLAAELITRIHNLLENNQQRLKQVKLGNAKSNSEEEKPTTWIQGLEQFCRSHVGAPNFSVNMLSEFAGINEKTLRHRMAAVNGLTPVKFVQEIRLQMGREMLEANQVRTIKEATAKVGFYDSRYFSKLFFERFGIRPSELLRANE